MPITVRLAESHTGADQGGAVVRLRWEVCLAAPVPSKVVMGKGTKKVWQGGKVQGTGTRH